MKVSKYLKKYKINTEALFEVFRTLAAIITALLIAIIIIFIVSSNPINSIKVFLLNPFLDEYARSEIINRSIPLIFSGLAGAIMLKAKQFNMFGEGGFFIGGLIGAVVAIYFKLPIILLPVTALFVAGITSGLFGSIPAILKAKLNVNEFVTSLMMNFIVFWIGLYLLGNIFVDPTAGDITTKIIPEAGRIPFFSQTSLFSTNIIIVLIFIIGVYVFMKHTKYGYNIKVTGDNIEFAKYSGINPSYPIFYSQVIGASIAGVGGATEILSNYSRFNWKTLPMYGFDGLMIAIASKNNPLVVPLIALFFGYIRTGANQMAIFTDVSSEIVLIIQAIIILLVAARAFLSSLRTKMMIKKVKALNLQEVK